jgi:predicted nucleic acid-binding protein
LNYLLDTNIVLGFLKQDIFSQYLQDTIGFPSRENIYAISIVILGELKSLALQRNWGHRKLNELDEFMSELLILDIFSEDIVEKYAETDAYSQGKHPKQSLPKGLTARNMGKSDCRSE